VVIKASSRAEIDALVSDLASDRPLCREAAIARLTVIGPRAVRRLVSVADNPAHAPIVRAAALRALEGIGDPRALSPALGLVDAADADVAVAAIAVARGFLRTAHGVGALDRLTATALDRRRAVPVRLAAIGALGDLEPSSLQPLVDTLVGDADVGPALSRARRPRRESASAVRVLEAAAGGPLPDDPQIVRRAVARAGRNVPLTLLHRLVERIRAHEEAEPEAARRVAWTAARAAAHAALAARGSRLGLYDIREAFEQANEPLPGEILTAVAEAGDVSCLGPLAAAYAKATKRPHAASDWWPRHLAEVFRAIAAREGLTRRHRVMKRIEQRWPQILD
jgi:hypothetical protein